MAFYRGTEGSVKFDDAGTSAAAIASTTGWTLNVVKETVDTTLIGDRTGYKGTEGGIISGTGTVKVLYTATSGDETQAFLKRVNTTGTTGNSLFELYTDTSGAKKISFKGVVTGSRINLDLDNLIQIDMDFATNGAITYAI